MRLLVQSLFDTCQLPPCSYQTDSWGNTLLCQFREPTLLLQHKMKQWGVFFRVNLTFWFFYWCHFEFEACCYSTLPPRHLGHGGFIPTMIHRNIRNLPMWWMVHVYTIKIHGVFYLKTTISFLKLPDNQPILDKNAYFEKKDSIFYLFHWTEDA